MGVVRRGASVDELLDQAVAAINRGDRAAATALAGRVLAVDHDNVEATDLLGASSGGGEIRRLTILFADLVDSTGLSARVEPETYRLLVGRYREYVHSTVNRFEGHVNSHQGDGLLAVFGDPIAHEDDVRRAVLAGLEITRQVARLNEQAQRRFGVGINVRVGVYRGLAYWDTAQGDVYGLAPNLAARVSGLAPPGSVVISEAIAPLIRDTFELQARPAAAVKGVDEPVGHSVVMGERAERAKIFRGPVVGRDRELVQLQKTWARARAGTLSPPGMVFRGEPGIGKSRLAAAAAELTEASGEAVLEMLGSPFHTDAGLHPVRTLLERRCGIGRRTDQAKRLRLLETEVRACGLEPQSTVPLLAAVLGIDAEAGYEPVPAQGRKLYELITEAVQTYLMACLGEKPALVVAEDVHWFDSSTLDVLGSLLAANQGGLLVVITGRPGGWLRAGWPVKVFDLTPLTDEQSDALVTALNPTLIAEQRAVVVDRCDGVPFYIEQVVAGLSETGVPEALYEPLFARLRATADMLPVVQAAAVIGRHMDRGLLCSMVDLSDDQVDEVIKELEDALVLEPWGSDMWRFRHELLREVAAELAPPSVRRGLHAKVADALVEVQGGDPDWRLVAGHYERAERFDQAASAYQQASWAARRRGALAEARTYLSLALAQLDRAAPGPVRDRREITLRLERGFLATAAEGVNSREAAADFERCLQLGGTDLHNDELFATLVALTGYYIALADLRRAAQVLEVLGSGLEQERQWFRPAIDASFGMVKSMRGEFAAAASHLEAATAVWAAEDQHRIDAVWFNPRDPIATARIHLAWTHCVRGDLAGAEAELAHAVHRTNEIDFPQGPFSLGYAHCIETAVRTEAAQLDRAAVLAADLIELAEQHGFDMWRLYGATHQAIIGGLAALRADHPNPAALSAHIETLTTLLDTFDTAGSNIYRTYFDGALGRLLIAAGQPEQARHRLDIGLALARDTGMHVYDAELLRLRAHTHTDTNAREADLAAALKLSRRQGATLFELRATLDDHDLRGQPAVPAVIDAASRIPAGCAWPELARAHGFCAR